MGYYFDTVWRSRPPRRFVPAQALRAGTKSAKDHRLCAVQPSAGRAAKPPTAVAATTSLKSCEACLPVNAAAATTASRPSARCSVGVPGAASTPAHRGHMHGDFYLQLLGGHPSSCERTRHAVVPARRMYGRAARSSSPAWNEPTSSCFAARKPDETASPRTRAPSRAQLRHLSWQPNSMGDAGVPGPSHLTADARRPRVTQALTRVVGSNLTL